MLRCLIAILTTALLSVPAFAQVARQFPQSALRGEIAFVNPPEVKLNGNAVVLAPGSRIRGQNNMIEMSGALAGQKLWVHYTVDTQGSVMDVWILRPDELAKKPWPANRAQAEAWQFDPAAQAWTRP
ncbi:MAG: hypothetical protein AD742_12090 [Methylibium sp. NZG]|nr:MAG: hypothetical protein AD742_12090 [Methylibium sp. NZG]